MKRATILEKNINDNLWPEIILAMTQVKNIRPTHALEKGNPHQALFDKPPDINHLQVFGSTVYVFIHKEEQNLKSEKFEAQALKSTLVGYDGHTIYRVFIREQDKVIRVKDLQIFEDKSEKVSITIPNFEGKPTFEGFFIIIQESNFSESNNTTITEPARPIEISNSRSGRALKPIAKAKERENSKQKQQKISSTSKLIIQLSQLLETNWEDVTSINIFATNPISSTGPKRNDKDESTSAKLDLFKILAIKLTSKANAQD